MSLTCFACFHKQEAQRQKELATKELFESINNDKIIREFRGLSISLGEAIATLSDVARKTTLYKQ